MTIRDQDKFIESLWDWGFLDDCFGDTGIKVGDGDGWVERNGLFLFIETKNPQATVPKGQERGYRAMTKRGDTVLIIWGQRNAPERMAVWRPGEYYADKPVRATTDDIKRVVHEWFLAADKKGEVA